MGVETRDCGSNSCKYKARGRGGMRTNGGCRCDTCLHCGQNLGGPVKKHHYWCVMENVCVNCETVEEHNDEGQCLFVPGGTYEPLLSIDIDLPVPWQRIAPLVHLIRMKLSPEGGKVTHDEETRALNLYQNGTPHEAS